MTNVTMESAYLLQYKAQKQIQKTRKLNCPVITSSKKYSKDPILNSIEFSNKSFKIENKKAMQSVSKKLFSAIETLVKNEQKYLKQFIKKNNCNTNQVKMVIDYPVEVKVFDCSNKFIFAIYESIYFKI